MSDLVIDALTAAGVAGQTTVRVELTDNRSNPVPGYVIGESDVIVAPVVATTDEDGHVVIDLIPNADINPPNTIYTVTVGDKNFTILKSGASQTLFEALIQDPPPLDPIPSSDFLQVDLNLSDLSDPSVARNSLGLGNSATKDTGTVAGSVATGDHIHAASAVTVAPFGTIASTNVQAALEEVLAESNPPASLVTFAPAGDIVATNVQAAVVEVDAELHAHEADTVDAHDASAISFVPGTGIAATDVQSAIIEAKTDSQTFSTAYTDAHISDTTAAHLASAIDYTPGYVLDTTNVQDGLNELAETFATTAVPSGFPNLTSTAISVVDSGAVLTFTIAPTSSTFDVWLFGDKFTKTTETVTMPDAIAVYYIYYTTAGVLSVASNSVQPGGFAWATQTPVAIVYRGTTNNDLALFDTRHGLTMDWATREYLHKTRGTQLGTGLALSNYVLSPGSPVNADNTWSITTGTLYNEDLTYTVPAIAAGGPYTTLYRTGTTEFTTLTSLATATPFAVSGSDIAYNLNTAGSYSLAAVPSGSFVNYYIFCTGSATAGYKTFAYPDSATYATQALAEAAAIVSPFAPGGFAYSEFFMRYRVTYQRSNAYTTTGRCRTVAVTAIAASQTLITGATPTDHSVLTGRSTVDSHPASAITVTPAGNITSTNLASALQELVDNDGSYATTTTDVLSSRVTGNATARFTLDADGRLNWGDGTLAQDCTLSRSGVSALTATTSLRLNPSIASASANDAIFRISGTLSGSGNTPAGIFFNTLYAPSASIAAAYGATFTPSFNPGTSITITDVTAMYCRVFTGGSLGAITNAAGLYIDTGAYSTIKPTNITGVDIKSQGGAGITTATGLSIKAQTLATTNQSLTIEQSAQKTLWVGNLSDSTTPAGGITFGSSADTNLYRSAANTLATDDSFSLNTVGGGFLIKEGTNATSGVATMVAGTVVVPTTKVTATSRIQLAIQSLGTVVLPQAIGVTARTAGTSFTISSAGATDTSVVAWVIIEPA